MLNARAAARHLFALALRLTGCIWWAERQIRNKRGLVVLAFHRVLTDEEFGATNSHPGIVVSRNCFRLMLDYITRHYVPTPLAEARPGRQASKLGMVLTFDDGWRDNYTNALPEAAGAGCTFAVMICPGLVGLEAPFWPEQAIGLLRERYAGGSMEPVARELEQLKKLTESEREAWFTRMGQALGSAGANADGQCGATLDWNEIAEMQAQGIEFGAHTQTHQILDTVEPERVAAEVGESRRSIERELKTVCVAFAYPNGNVNPDIRRVAAAEGIKLAFTTAPGVWYAETDPLMIPRVNISESNVTGMDGRFSSTMFRYAVTWKAWRASRLAKAGAGGAELAAEHV